MGLERAWGRPLATGGNSLVTDPDDAKNVFYSNLDVDPNGGTVVEAKVTYADLNQNYHGGGIWMGTDEDHYIRLGVINNNGVAVEALR